MSARDPGTSGDEEADRRASARVRQQSRPRPVDGPGAPDPNPQSDIEADTDRRREEMNEAAAQTNAGPSSDLDRDRRASRRVGGDDGDSGGRRDRQTQEERYARLRERSDSTASDDRQADREASRRVGGGGTDDGDSGGGDGGISDDRQADREASRRVGGGGGGGGRDTGRDDGPSGGGGVADDRERDRRASRRVRDDRDTAGDTGGRERDRPDVSDDFEEDRRASRRVGGFQNRQGVETRPGSVGDQASDLERRAIEQTEGLDDPEQVRVIQRGDRLVAELTSSGREALAERQSREIAASVAPAARAVAQMRDLEPSQSVLVEGARDDFREDQVSSQRTRSTGEQFGDFRVGIPGTDQTVEGVFRDAAQGYDEFTSGFLDETDQIALPTPAGSIGVSTETNPVGRFAMGTAEGAVALGNVPAAAVGLDEAAETAGFVATETIEGRGGRATDDLEQAAELAVADAADAARADPFGVGGQAAGSLVVSAGLIGGATRVSQTAGRGAAFAIQPGEELVSSGLSRAFPSVARRFPNERIDNEEIVMRGVQRAGDRIRRTFRRGGRDAELMTDGGMNLPRGRGRGQLQLSGPELSSGGSEIASTEIAGTEPVPGRTPGMEGGGALEPGGGRRGSQGRGVGSGNDPRGRQSSGPPGLTGEESFEGVGSRSGRSRRLLERERERVAEAQRQEVLVEDGRAARGTVAAALLAEQTGRLDQDAAAAGVLQGLQSAQEPQVRERADAGFDLDSLVRELGVTGSRTDTELGQEFSTELDQEFETEVESETETEVELESVLEFELGLETESEQELEFETEVELERELERELFGDRRDRTPDEAVATSGAAGRRLLEFDVAGFEEVLGR